MMRLGEDEPEGFNVVEGDRAEESAFVFEHLDEVGEDDFDDFAGEVRGGEGDEPADGRSGCFEAAESYSGS
jgi:hypothetical protein